MPANSSHSVDTLCAAGFVWYKRIGVIAQNTDMKKLINGELHNAQRVRTCCSNRPTVEILLVFGSL